MSGTAGPLRDTQGNAVPTGDDEHRRPGQKTVLKPSMQHAPGFVPATKFKLQKFGRRVKAAVRKVLKKARDNVSILECCICVHVNIFYFTYSSFHLTTPVNKYCS